MALADIVSSSDIYTELAVTDSDDQALIDNLRKRTERQIRQYARWPITEATYTEYLPARVPIGARLPLMRPFVTAVTSVHEDRFSRGGQQADDFASATELTQGTDFWLDYDESTYSRTGTLVRYDFDWPDYIRSVKVVYTAGFDATALGDEFLFVKQAVIDEVGARFYYRKERQGSSGASGTIKSEKLKDYAVAYLGTDPLGTDSSGLLSITRAAIDPIVYYGHMF